MKTWKPGELELLACLLHYGGECTCLVWPQCTRETVSEYKHWRHEPIEIMSHQVKVGVTLRLAVYRQSLRLVASPLRCTTRDCFFFLQLNPSVHSPYVASSLTRGWGCLLWIDFASPLSNVRIAHVICYWKFFLVHYKQVLCQSRFCIADLV
jgi:hypothetical protein